jgi:ubiquinone/menaquinone biosynthesis C-methylase UbiE
MHLSQPDIELLCQEHSLYLPLITEQAHILELGCGNADKARSIIRAGKAACYLALEADPAQHARNQALTDLAKVRFVLAGAEEIPAEDNSFDLVLMFKSLHHVPLDQMDCALHEIHRVLKPGGLAYISEPVFAGDYNEILRLFHDEEQVRIAAFAAIERSVASGLLQLVEEKFFKTEVRFRDFPQFEQRVIGVTYQQHRLTAECLAEVRARFIAHMGPDGARFHTPNRLDLLRKP